MEGRTRQGRAVPVRGALHSPCAIPPTTKPAETIHDSTCPSDSDSGEPGPAEPVPDRDEPTGEGKRAYPLPPRCRQNAVLPEDTKTPDSHVERDPRLIRLTGIHPFNVEAPLSDLFNEGFLTSKDLHYVRNHGPVPRVEDDRLLDWGLSVEGMVENPARMTLRDLLADYEQLTYPITLVCAGNRRKEQNIVRKTKGFSWGAGGLSTALWTGVALSDLLSRAVPKRGARYVCFEGADRLPNGYYGTSVKLAWAMDPNRGILVAHKMNGETLHPDHGKPLRVVIPGQIGGRSVKWLTRIVVTAKPSDNWYHIYDNRVLPTMVTWSRPRPAPACPKSGQMRDTPSTTSIPTAQRATRLTTRGSRLADGLEAYTVRGYAYAGGGQEGDEGRGDSRQGKDMGARAHHVSRGRVSVSARGGDAIRREAGPVVEGELFLLVLLGRGHGRVPAAGCRGPDGPGHGRFHDGAREGHVLERAGHDEQPVVQNRHPQGLADPALRGIRPSQP